MYGAFKKSPEREVIDHDMRTMYPDFTYTDTDNIRKEETTMKTDLQTLAELHAEVVRLAGRVLHEAETVEAAFVILIDRAKELDEEFDRALSEVVDHEEKTR